MRVALTLFLILCLSSFFCQDASIDSLKHVLTSAKEDTNQVNTLNNLTKALYAISEYEASIEYARKAEVLSQKTNFQKGLSTALMNLSIISYETGDFEKAMNYCLKAKEIREALGDRVGVAKSLNNICSIYTMQGNYSKALEICIEAIKILETTNDKNTLASCYGSLGNIYNFLSDFPKALEAFTKALVIFEDLGDKVRISRCLTAIGMTHRNLYHFTEALKYLERALKLDTELNAKIGIVTTLHNIGTVYSDLGEYDKAISYFNRSLDLANELNHQQGVCASLNAVGNMYAKLKQYDKAVERCKQSLSIAEKIGNLEVIQEANKSLSDIYELKGDESNAFKYYKEFVKAKDSIFSEESRNKISDLQIKYETEKKENENKLLSQENEIQALQLSKNRYFIFGLAGLLLVVFLLFFILIRQNRLRSQQKTIALEQKLLRSQMNPHFIFNALTAIQNFILTNDQRTATKYLSSFANITRSVLENSRLELIPLQKEISLLENYFQLQKLRFPDKFSYEIHVDEVLDKESVLIPPMLCQPFIENALEHGMKDIDSGGIIDIYITEKDNFLLLEIKDNGKGITEDASNKKHHSLATAITRERLDLMNKKTEQKSFFSISDAYPGEIRKGVKVNFSLPLQHL